MDLDESVIKLAAFGLFVCISATIIARRSKRQPRRFKRRPINRRRNSGNYQYYKKMKAWDAPQFFKYTRMTIPVFQKLLSKIRLKIKRQSRSDGITPEERLVITLQYLSQGTSMQVLAWTFHIGITTVHKIVHETCRTLWDELSSDYLKSPSSEAEWQEISEGFLHRWNFPNCLGAIDGKHINIQAPAKSGSQFFNYKKRFSIVLLASCDSNYKFRLVDIGAYGSHSDGGVLKNSTFGKRLEASTFNIPKSKALPFSDIELPYFLIGDEAFPLKEYIMRPYPGKNLSEKQRIFNYRLSRARQTIENTFGIMVARWRILKTTINAKVENVDNIVKAITVLHNYCQVEMTAVNSDLYSPAGYVDTGDQQNGAWREEQEPLQSVGRLGSNLAKKIVYEIRDALSHYFSQPSGQVPWQNNIINKGQQFK